MKRSIWILFFLLVLIVLIVLYVYRHELNPYRNPNFRPNCAVPRMVHLIYIPWDKQQKLKSNYLDFDHTCYRTLVRKFPDYEIVMWTLPRIQHFLRTEYPQFYEFIFALPRPTMIVDFLRLLLVYHFGGIYWQYDSKCITDRMDYFLPSEGKNVKLFTEIILSDRSCKMMAEEPIRRGVPEEPVRVCNQIFSAVPKHPYMLQLFMKAVDNMKSIGTVKRDYDILYIGANAMMSAMYDQVGQYQPDIELVDETTKRRMIGISSKGSWRTDGEKFSLGSVWMYLFP